MQPAGLSTMPCLVMWQLRACGLEHPVAECKAYQMPQACVLVREHLEAPHHGLMSGQYLQAQKAAWADLAELLFFHHRRSGRRLLSTSSPDPSEEHGREHDDWALETVFSSSRLAHTKQFAPLPSAREHTRLPDRSVSAQEFLVRGILWLSARRWTDFSQSHLVIHCVKHHAQLVKPDRASSALPDSLQELLRGHGDSRQTQQEYRFGNRFRR